MKKKPTKPSEPISAPKPQETAKTACAGILYTSPGVPAGLSPAGYTPKGETDWRRFHEVNVREQRSDLDPRFVAYVLYNRSEVCGTRLIKGAGFPLEVAHPNVSTELFAYGDLEAAKAAADLLQDYLDNYENKHLEVARKRYEKENALITA